MVVVREDTAGALRRSAPQSDGSPRAGRLAVRHRPALTRARTAWATCVVRGALLVTCAPNHMLHPMYDMSMDSP